MANLPALPLYPFDPTGQLAGNYIVNEQHTVTEANFRDYYFIVPVFAPFYITDFSMKITEIDGTVRNAVEGQDFTFVLPFMAGVRETGIPMYGAIALNQTLTNGILSISYRTLGGNFIANPALVLQNLAEKVYNPRTTLWDTVTNVPQIFPPSEHHQPADTVYGMQKLIEAINSVSAVIVANQGGSGSGGSTGGGSSSGPDPYYGIIVDKETVRSGGKIAVQVIKDLVNSPETVYWTIIHQNSTVLNFDAVHGELPLTQDVTGFKGSFEITCNLLTSNSVSFVIAVRKSSSLGPILALSDVITISNSENNVALSGLWTGNNVEGKGFTFDNDRLSGVVNPNNGEISIFAKNKKMITLSGNTDSITFSFGTNSGYLFEYRSDGNVRLTTSGGQIIWSTQTAATVSYVDNKISTLLNNAGPALDTLGELAAALGNDPNFATTILNSLNSKQGALGFTPVQQGTGINQLTNPVKLGWSGTRLKATVDNTDLGNFVFDSQLTTNLGNYLKLDGSNTMTGQLQGAAIASNVNQSSDTSSILVRNNGGTGDSNVAAIGFQCLNNAGIKMHLRADGYFGIGGLTQQTWKWYVAANGDMTTAGDVISYSDPRLKNDVTKIEDALAIVRGMNGVRFTWNKRSELIANKAGVKDVGVMADEVKAVLPEVVREIIKDENNGETYLGVAYEKIVPVLIEAIKELEKKVEYLSSKVTGDGN